MNRCQNFYSLSFKVLNTLKAERSPYLKVERINLFLTDNVKFIKRIEEVYFSTKRGKLQAESQ